MDFTPNRRKAVLGGLLALAMAAVLLMAACWIYGMPRNEGDAVPVAVWLLSIFAALLVFAGAIQLFWWRPEQLRIDELGIRITRGGETVQLRWDELDAVDVVTLRSAAAGLTWVTAWNTRRLVARPAGDSSSPRTARGRLWDSKAKAYTLDVETFREPPPAVEAALVRYAGDRYRGASG